MGGASQPEAAAADTNPTPKTPPEVLPSATRTIPVDVEIEWFKISEP